MYIVYKNFTTDHKQSHYKEILLWEIFMEQELKFGLDLGRMANFPAFIALMIFCSMKPLYTSKMSL